MGDCIFCKIIIGEIPCSKVYEDQNIFAFLDIGPVNKGHILVVPKKHSANLLEASDDDLQKSVLAIKKISKALLKAVDAEGLNVINNTKPAAGQVVFHTHFHIIPRFSDDGHKHWPQREYSSAEEMDTIKSKIIKHIEGD